jgi:hypothetical protein
MFGFDSHTLPPYLVVSETFALRTREHKGTLRRCLHVPVGSKSRTTLRAPRVRGHPRAFAREYPFALSKREMTPAPILSQEFP